MIQLVNMPFGSVMRAPIALGIMKAQLNRVGLPARAYNLNFDFGRLIGFGAYETIARFKGVETQVSEWLFAGAAWRRPFGPDEEHFLRLCGEEIETIPHVADPVSWLRAIRQELVEPYLEGCYERLVEEGHPRVVAFSCMFFQTIAALALGRMLKERHPEITLAYGGACFHGDAGQELFEKVPWIDVVSTGEADDVVVPLFAALSRGDPPVGLAGILARGADGRVARGIPSAPTSAAALEALPDPDYDDFFEDAGRVGLLDDRVWLDRASLPFEASRGCWWGQKKHCTFCGLNGEGMEFRVKSADSVLATLTDLSARYPVRNLQATDNILAMSYFKSFLPRVAEAQLQSYGRPVDLFFEVKPNLTRAQIKALADANVSYVQPGIESLSSHILEVIDKGVTGLQNVFFLKCATEFGLLPIWNLLIRIPRERPEDYAHMEAWIPRLHHLRPPTGGTPRVECHRYSPYFVRKGVWVDDLRPARWYRGLYPEEEIDLAKVAYYFEVTWKETLGDPAYDGIIRATHEWMRRWRQAEVPRLVSSDLAGGGLEIVDTRGGEAKVWNLPAGAARLYRQLHDIATPTKVRAQLAPDPAGVPTVEDVRRELRQFVDQGLALEEDDHFLGLALPPTVAPPLEKRRIQTQRLANQHPAAPPRHA